MSPQIPASIPLRVNMVGEDDGLVAPGQPLRRPDTPVLIKGSSAFNGGGVDSFGPIQVVCPTIAGNGACGCGSRRPATAPAINDVIFYERVSRPPIESQLVIAGRLPDAGIVAYSP